MMLWILLLFNISVNAQAPDWSQSYAIPPDGRANPYQIPAQDLPETIRKGRLHALNYPVTVSGLILPYQPIKNATEVLLSFDTVQSWLGLQPYPRSEGEGVFQIPFANGQRPNHRMGFTRIGQGFSISCAECHAATLFGRQILGMTNRFPRANEFFVHALKIADAIPSDVFQLSTGATNTETKMYSRARFASHFIGAKAPIHLGLDTSLAQVALSLARREPDEWATRNPNLKPRAEPLSREIADSKPAVWWNLKYKNRWLSDGSVVSGNPILTNFLWNEIGRGTDLKQFADWLGKNENVVRELTTAVFQTPAPRWTDFFPAQSISEPQARNGQRIFLNRCAGCHGLYEKAWDNPNKASLPWLERMQTERVIYPERTFVVDVGTDPGRRLGIKSLTQLNRLRISRDNGVRIEEQPGYVPPPLVGIWARWPYLHNNSVPTLCALLTAGSRRPKTYWARSAENSRLDFDADCNGYPKTSPREGLQAAFYDTLKSGSSNLGHDEGIFLRNGIEMLTREDKRDLIRFLQTL